MGARTSTLAQEEAALRKLHPDPEKAEARIKERKWSELSRSEKHASILYPGLVSESRRKEMEEIARGEGKRPPFSNARKGAR
jgi:hypothetical protein